MGPDASEPDSEIRVYFSCVDWPALETVSPKQTGCRSASPHPQLAIPRSWTVKFIRNWTSPPASVSFLTAAAIRHRSPGAGPGRRADRGFDMTGGSQPRDRIASAASVRRED